MPRRPARRWRPACRARGPRNRPLLRRERAPCPGPSRRLVSPLMALGTTTIWWPARPFGDAPGDVADALGRAHRRAAVLVNDQCHGTAWKFGACGWRAEGRWEAGPAQRADSFGQNRQPAWLYQPAAAPRARRRCPPADGSGGRGAAGRHLVQQFVQLRALAGVVMRLAQPVAQQVGPARRDCACRARRAALARGQVGGANRSNSGAWPHAARCARRCRGRRKRLLQQGSHNPDAVAGEAVALVGSSTKARPAPPARRGWPGRHASQRSPSQAAMRCRTAAAWPPGQAIATRDKASSTVSTWSSACWASSHAACALRHRATPQKPTRHKRRAHASLGAFAGRDGIDTLPPAARPSRGTSALHAARKSSAAPPAGRGGCDGAPGRPASRAGQQQQSGGVRPAAEGHGQGRESHHGQRPRSGPAHAWQRAGLSNGSGRRPWCR